MRFCARWDNCRWFCEASAGTQIPIEGVATETRYTTLPQLPAPSLTQEPLIKCYRKSVF